MDLEERDLAALEERLYSSIHHAYENPQSVFDPAPVTPSTTARVVSRNAVINNGSGTLPANMKRYWAGSAVPSYGDRGAPYPGNKPQTGVAPKPSSPATTAPGNVSEGGITEVTKMFITPYQSLLGNMGDPPPVESPSVPVESAHQSTPSIVAPAAKHIPQKDPGLQLKKKKQTKQPLLAVEKKLANLTKLINKDRKQNAAQTMEVKKAKAKKMRHRKQQQQQQQIVAEIILNSSDDEVSKPRPARPERSSAPVPLSDDETDEVIIIPTPPPPQICIDCSDEEEERPPPSVQFALPKSQKKKKKKPTSVSPRCLSPSNSSIMSDDFIGQHDRSRLNDSFTESIPNDDELECAVEGAPRPGASGKGKKSTPEARQERVPSISSEDTVCTSSETTDQEKRPQEAEKGSASKSQSQQCNESATKGKKDSATNTKKTPSKVKASKAVPASPSIAAAAVSPSVAKNNANSNKAVAAGSNDTASNAKPQGKTKARSKSPLTLVLEAARKHFEMEPKQPRDGSAKKTKSKKDSSVQKEPTATPGTPTDKVVSECAANEPAPSKSTAGPKGKKKKNLTTIAPVDDVVSSESDYDIARPASKASTPKGPPGKKSRRSASNFFEQMGDVSSESDYDESFLQEEKGNEKHKQAKESKKRLGRKRKQYNSETYSDEDFACLLTDIVRAVSDTEDEEDEDDNDDDADGDVAALLANEGKTGTKAADTAATSKKRKQNSLTEQQTPSKAARNLKKKKKLNEQPPAATSEELPADQEQPEVVVAKKKKKQKEPKASAKKRLAGSGCSTPEVQAVCLEQSSTNTPAQRSKDLMEEDSRAVHNATSEPDQIQIIADSDVDGDDDDDDDLRIIDNSFNGRSSVASGGSCSSKAPPVGPDCAWNDEMKQFYNTSWADEDLNLKSILRQMPRDSRHWYLLLKDRYPDPPRKEIICSNCGERGHVRFKCRNAPKLVTCYMCGEQGHREPRCPKTVCLNCGAKTRNFVRGCKTCARDADTICFSCGVRGHTQRSCPDLWRRYHSTIEDNVPLKEDFVKNPKARWCCVCCRHGHQAHKCNDARRIFGHPIPNTSVSSYLPAYRGEYNRSSKRQTEEQQRRLALDPTARYNLLSSDANGCELNLSEMTQNENGFYYNFLRTTGLLEKYEKRPSVDDVVEVVEQQQQQQQEEAPPAVKQEKDEVLLIESSPPAEPVVSQQEQDEIEPKEEEISPQVTPAPCNQTDSQRAALTIVEENSNYSFSEFHTEEEKQPEVACETSGGGITSRPSEDRTSANINSSQSQQAALSLDFIPLSTEPEVPDLFTLPPLPPRPPRPQRPPLPILPTAEQATLPSPQQTPEPPANAIVRAADSDRSIMPKADEPVETDAKVVLSKDHAKVLLSLKGSEFLNEAGQRHNVRLSITFESVGNMLQIHGTTEAQDRFHEELVRYLSGGTQQKVIADNNNIEISNCPKLSNKMAKYIRGHLKQLVSSQHLPMSKLLENWSNANQANIARHRRKLNILLFGVYGMREGRRYLNVLRTQLALCLQTKPRDSEVPQAQRDTVNEAIRYIFTGYDHKDYATLADEFEELKHSNKLRRITFFDLEVQQRPLKADAVNKNKTCCKRPTQHAADYHYLKFIETLKTQPQKKQNKSPIVKKDAKKPRTRSNSIAEKRAQLDWNHHQEQHEEQRFNQEEQQADDYIDTDATMHHNGEGNRRYADDFIMNTYADQQIDSDRLDQLDSSTRHVQESDWMANGSNYQQQQQQQQQQDLPQHCNEWYDDRDQNRWAVFDSTPPQTEHRFQWFGQSNDVGPSGPSGAFPASVARLTEWDNTLREQELSQLERLQNMLR